MELGELISYFKNSINVFRCLALCYRVMRKEPVIGMVCMQGLKIGAIPIIKEHFMMQQIIKS